MKRDMNLALRILRLLAGMDGPDKICGLNADALETDTETALYHIELLVEGGYIKANPKRKFPFEVERLTWRGHDLLDALSR